LQRSSFGLGYAPGCNDRKKLDIPVRSKESLSEFGSRLKLIGCPAHIHLAAFQFQRDYPARVTGTFRNEQIVATRFILTEGRTGFVEIDGDASPRSAFQAYSASFLA